MLHLRVLLLLLGAALALAAVAGAASTHYDDDPTPHKIYLEDLEVEQELPQRLEAPPPTLPTHYHNDKFKQISIRPPLATRPSAPAASSTPLRFPRPSEEEERGRGADDDDDNDNDEERYDATRRYTYDIRPYLYNGEEQDPSELVQPRGRPLYEPSAALAHRVALQQQLHQQHLQQHQLRLQHQQQEEEQHQQQQQQQYAQLSDGYALKQTPTSAYVLVPPFGDGDANGISGEHGPYDERDNGNSNSVDGADEDNGGGGGDDDEGPDDGNAEFGIAGRHRVVSYAPTEPSATDATALHRYASSGGGGGGSGGVHYLTGNELPGAPVARRPASEYGPPYRRPTLVLPHSNQFVYAPQRRPDVGRLTAAPPTVPYPPSFVSITTTRRPGDYPPTAAARDYYSRPFRPSSVDPVPDFFSGRKTKSLLDSYIPSWVVARMLQEQRQRGPAYTSATPYTRQHFKRALNGDRPKPLPTAAKAQRKAAGDQMLMTE